MTNRQDDKIPAASKRSLQKDKEKGTHTRILLALCSLFSPYTEFFIISLSSCILRSVRAMVSAHSFSPSEIFCSSSSPFL